MDSVAINSGLIFKALPIQLIETDLGVLLRRGSVQFKIQGKGVAKAIRHLLSLVPKKGTTVRGLLTHFEPQDRLNIERLIQRLIDKRFFVPIETNDNSQNDMHETPLDVFYWHFGETSQQVNLRLNDRLLVIMGVNTISRQLIQTLAFSGIRNVQIIDHPQLRTPSFIADEGGLDEFRLGNRVFPLLTLDEWQTTSDIQRPMTIMVTSDLGLTPDFHEWNRFCVEQKQHFCAVWLEDMVGYLGPLVIPGESPCFACARGRMNSQIDDHKTQNFFDNNSFPGKHPVGFHPAMTGILGNLAAFELLKFYSELFTRSSLGRLMEVSLLGPWMKTRKIFKLPRCSVCSPLQTTPSMTPKLDVSMETK